jgi:hypothetical protein
MPIEIRPWIKALSLAAVFLAPFSLHATTIEVESDDELIQGSPTPSAPAPMPPKQVPPAPSKPSGNAPAVPTPPMPPAVVPASQQAPANPPAQASVTTKRVRISDNVGFYYFVKASYVADPDNVPNLGYVIGSSDIDMAYSMPKHSFIEAASDKVKFSAGDLLVVYRTAQPVSDDRLGSLGYQVQNLAIVRVIETQTNRYLVETVKSFDSFQDGDKVESYDTEIQRWKQAQIKKPLPAQPVTCFVLGGWGQAGQLEYNQEDYIYLSAGTKEGVVEGQSFRIWKVTETGLMEEALRTPVGEAQVIYAGPDVSTAKILKNSQSIERNFEADYKP